MTSVYYEFLGLLIDVKLLLLLLCKDSRMAVGLDGWYWSLLKALDLSYIGCSESDCRDESELNFNCSESWTHNWSYCFLTHS